ncbi:MAG: lipopolysaccharide heptosyltransferase II [Candidatus Schekmanbacteria bacterium]|nr:MAG: lipopolysaccharide heptosyltransferase II [Candidatus Schekmanbacteria bacterium]
MLKKDKVKKLFIRESNWIGDAVMTLPALKALREFFKEAHITIGAKESITTILKECGLADNYITIPHPAKGLDKARKLKLLKECGRENFDAAILFTNSFESALEVFLMKIPTRIGYATDGRSLLLTQAVPLPSNLEEMHEVEYFSNLIKNIGIDVDDDELRLELSKKDKEFAESFFKENNLSNKLTAIIHTGTSTKERQWHLERYAQVCRYLIEKYDAAVILSGSKDDIEDTNKVKSLVKGEIFDMAGKLSICQTAAIIEKASIFIGNDSGPMHIASALKTPIVVIFGPGNHHKTHPYTKPELYIQVKKEFQCRPCKQRFFKECSPAPSGKPECIESIEVKDVVDACDKIISTLDLNPKQNRTKL